MRKKLNTASTKKRMPMSTPNVPCENARNEMLQVQRTHNVR